MKTKNPQRVSLFLVFGDRKYEPKGSIIMEETKQIELEFTKKLDSAVKYEMNLSGCSLAVLNYYLINMGKDNKVRTHQDVRNLIKDFIVVNGGKRYEDTSIRYSIKVLVENRILLPTMFRGMHYVNPLVYSRVNESERKQLIKDLCVERVLVETDFKK